MTAFRIPFNRPTRVDNQSRYLAEALAGGHWSGDGPFTRRCHERLEAQLGVRKALLTTSCTHALEMAARGRCSPTSARTRSTSTNNTSTP